MLKYKLHPEAKTLDVIFEDQTINVEILSSTNVNVLRAHEKTGETPVTVSNDYLKTLSLESQEVIFEAIKSTVDILITYPDGTEDNYKEINTLLTNIIRLPGMEEETIRAWCVEHVPIPAAIDSRFTKAHELKGHSHKQTYIKDEYLDAIAFTIVIKVFYPILQVLQKYPANKDQGSMFGRPYGKVRNKSSKDPYLYRRIAYTIVPKELREFKAFRKLEDFVSRITNDSVVTSEGVLGKGVTSETKIEFVISVLMLYDLTKACINTGDDKNVISHLYTSIKQIFRVDDKRSIKDKPFSYENGLVERNMTELYKDRMDFFMHDEVAYLFVAGFENLIDNYRHLLDVGDVREQYRKMCQDHMNLSWIQETTASNILRNVVPPDIFKIMDTQTMKGCCCVASNIIKNDHPEISGLLLSSYETIRTPDGLIVPKAYAASTTEPKRELLNTLKVMYPFYTTKEVGDKLKTVDDLTNDKHILHEYNKVNTEDYKTKSWNHHICDKMVPFYKEKGVIDGDKLVFKPNIPELLINLYLDIDNIGVVSTDGFEKAIAGELII